MVAFKSTRNNSCMTFVLLATLLVVSFSSCSSSAEPSDSSNSVNRDSQASNQDGGFGIPKRQYLIAPRIGRSPAIATTGHNNGLSTHQQGIWSALEEAALNQAGQLQPNRGYPSPMRSPLLYLIGNRRTIGQRSSGLLPQARIGRRAVAPMGLMPQPRVGRRSIDDQVNGQDEVAVATLSDSSLSDAIEELVEGGQS